MSSIHQVKSEIPESGANFTLAHQNVYNDQSSSIDDDTKVNQLILEEEEQNSEIEFVQIQSADSAIVQVKAENKELIGWWNRSAEGRLLSKENKDEESNMIKCLYSFMCNLQHIIAENRETVMDHGHVFSAPITVYDWSDIHKLPLQNTINKETYERMLLDRIVKGRWFVEMIICSIRYRSQQQVDLYFQDVIQNQTMVGLFIELITLLYHDQRHKLASRVTTTIQMKETHERIGKLLNQIAQCSSKLQIDIPPLPALNRKFDIIPNPFSEKIYKEFRNARNFIIMCYDTGNFKTQSYKDGNMIENIGLVTSRRIEKHCWVTKKRLLNHSLPLDGLVLRALEIENTTMHEIIMMLLGQIRTEAQRIVIEMQKSKNILTIEKMIDAIINDRYMAWVLAAMVSNQKCILAGKSAQWISSTLLKLVIKNNDQHLGCLVTFILSL